jgi:EmrB/QacA subfamily drug resistance transporter
VQNTTQPGSQNGNNKWLAIAGIGMGVFMATLDASIVNISLPILVEELNTDFATITWVVLSYVLVLTSLMLGAARLGDMIDKKKLYFTGLALFTFSSLLCGLAPDVEWLIAFRALQGMGAAMTQALGAAIISEVFPAKERGRALGIIGSTVSIGIAVGPPVGGLLIGLAGWRSIFLVNVPVGIITLLVISRFVPSSPARAGQRFDGLGAFILFVTLACYALGMTFGQQQGFDMLLPRALVITAVVGFIVFIYSQTRIQQPMIDLRIFRNILFSLNLLMGFLVFVVMAGMYIMPFFLTLVRGFPIQQVGLIMMATPIAMGVIAPLAGTLSDRFGSRGISLAGLLMIIVGCLSLSTLSPEVSALGFVARLVPFGIGMGLFQSPNNSAIMGAAPRDRMGVASGLLALARTLGQTTGVPLMGSLFTTLVITHAGLQPGADITTIPGVWLVQGINVTYRIAAFIILGSVILASLALWIDSRRKRQVVPDPSLSA